MIVSRLVCIVFFLSLCMTSRSAEQADKHDLTASWDAGQPLRVRANFQVGGQLKITTDEKQAKSVPMSVVADIQYQEMPLDNPAQSQSQQAGVPAWQTVRQYETAKATIKIDKGGMNLKLPVDQRTILATLHEGGSLLVSPVQALSREHLDLIDLPFATHLLDLQMPTEPVSVGQSWSHKDATMQILLGMDQISVCEVQSELVGIKKGFAQIRLEGKVQGTMLGASTEIEVKAGYLFDLNNHRIARMNAYIKEQRKPGQIGPGVDVVAKLNLKIDTDQLDNARRTQMIAAAGRDAQPNTQLQFVHDKSGTVIMHDRRWHVTGETHDRWVMRCIDAGTFIAQCNASVLARRKEGRQPTLAEFEKDVRFALGKKLESIDSSKEWVNAAGLRCYRLIVSGNVDDVPMQWRYYLAAPQQGRRVSMSISVEPHLADRLDDSDLQIVESLVLGEPTASPPVPTKVSRRRAASATK